MRNRCVWLFLGLVFLAVSVSGESLIEVDENGDEYELKRFYIQGRQLKGDGSQSQCVVTRRKRSGRALSAGTKTGETGASVQVSSQTLNVESLPAMMEHREGAATLQEVNPSKRRYVALTGVHYEPHVPNDEEENDDEDDDEDLEDEAEAALAGQSSKSQSPFVPAALALPLAQGSQASSQGGAEELTSSAHLPLGVSVVANAASHANVAEDAGIVVVQSHQPPKVNPDTHAVFELKPIQADVQQPAVSFYPFVHPWEAVLPEDEDDYDEEDYDEEDYDDFYYGGNAYYRDQPGYVGLGEYDEHIVSEDSPMSTTAIWSTDADDGDIHPVINQPNKRPNQNKKKNKNKNKNSNKKNPKRKAQKNKKRVPQKKRKEEMEDDHELMTQKRKKNKEQKEKDHKKKQDKEQGQELQQDQMDQSPVDVIKKPAAVASSSAQSSISSSSSSGSSSSMSSASNSSGSNSSVDKKKKKKKKPSSSSSSSSSTSKRRTKKKKKQSSSSSLSSGNRRRRPSSSSYSSAGYSGSSSSSSIGGYRRRRPQLTQQQRRRRKQQNTRRRLQQQKRRRNRNKNRQFYGNEPIINCIYINKDPPTTTTPRPFWNILGRQSDDQNAKAAQAPGQDTAAVEPVDPVAKQAVMQAVRRNFGEFGGRKRTNLRFVS
ncbi:uncharacterized protein [Drosophila kikkawai]|uniref:Uncharacterized protein n=1 Tax=Drosophila kikkawai TaxID=30033 RepID=A0ABM4GP81_DROKI